MSASAPPVADSARVQYSVIVLVEEASDGFAEFVDRLHTLFRQKGRAFEIIIVANGFEGFLRHEAQRRPQLFAPLKAIAFPKKIPQAVCLKAAFEESRGAVVVVCGSYQQIADASLMKCVETIGPDADIVSPRRTGRVDPFLNRIQSQVFNYLTRKMAGTGLNDMSCTVKVFRREVLGSVQLYGNMFRFLPILAAGRGFKVTEIPCEHVQERGKTGFYSLPEYGSRLIDILTLFFNIRFIRKPFRFFSLIGLFFSLAGFGVLAWVLIQKTFSDIPIGDRPELILGSIMIALGVQAASVGLLGEIVAFTHGRAKSEYTIDKII